VTSAVQSPELATTTPIDAHVDAPIDADTNAPIDARAHTATILAGHWHAGVWMVWALAAAACVQLAPSPLYVALVVGVAALAVSLHTRPGPYARAFPILLGIGVFFAVARMVLTALTTHGLGDVLFSTPELTLPRLLGGFTVGGPIELQVMLHSLAEGFAIVGVMAVFGAFNSVVSHSELVQSTPRAFYEVGLVVIVALAFVPSTLNAIADVREADRARTGGRVVRRGRLLRQVVPVLELGLERAVTLAESMDSRGFARMRANARDRVAGWCGVASLLALGGAFVALVGERNFVASVLGLGGALGLAFAVALASSSTERIRYRPRRMRAADWLVALAALAAPVALSACALTDDTSLAWFASQPLRWPTLHVLPALALVPLLVPVLAPRWDGS
jgi:energy-coupling factor transport system permease protein